MSRRHLSSSRPTALSLAARAVDDRRLPATTRSMTEAHFADGVVPTTWLAAIVQHVECSGCPLRPTDALHSPPDAHRRSSDVSIADIRRVYVENDLRSTSRSRPSSSMSSMKRGSHSKEARVPMARTNEVCMLSPTNRAGLIMTEDVIDGRYPGCPWSSRSTGQRCKYGVGVDGKLPRDLPANGTAHVEGAPASRRDSGRRAGRLPGSVPRRPSQAPRVRRRKVIAANMDLWDLLAGCFAIQAAYSTTS